MAQPVPVVPTSFRACARCHLRKVKCDGVIPQCGACRRSDAECNITTCVTFSYATVRHLQEQVETLQQQVAQLHTTSTSERLHGEPLETGHSHDVETQLLQAEIPRTERGTGDFVAEEVGNLALGALDGSSHRYGT